MPLIGQYTYLTTFFISYCLDLLLIVKGYMKIEKAEEKLEVNGAIKLERNRIQIYDINKLMELKKYHQ